MVISSVMKERKTFLIYLMTRIQLAIYCYRTFIEKRIIDKLKNKTIN